MWYERPLHHRAQRGGELGVNDRFYRGGQIMPFYVPRPSMPQINEEDYSEFFEFCTGANVVCDRELVSPDRLHPHQLADPFKAKAMPPEVLNKAVLVSEDYFILDGNHRWMAHVLMGTDVPIVKLTLDFEAAIALMFRFPKTYSIGYE